MLHGAEEENRMVELNDSLKFTTPLHLLDNKIERSQIITGAVVEITEMTKACGCMLYFSDQSYSIFIHTVNPMI